MRDHPEEDPEREAEGGSGILSRRGAKAYQWAVEAVFSIPVGIGLGWWADAKLGTAPWLLLLGLGFGFTAFVTGLLRMRRLVGEASEDAAAADADGPEHRG